jgi:hypothetical protein
MWVVFHGPMRRENPRAPDTSPLERLQNGQNGEPRQRSRGANSDRLRTERFEMKQIPNRRYGQDRGEPRSRTRNHRPH